MNDPVPAEEKLLRLIRKKDKTKAKKGNTEKGKKDSSQTSSFENKNLVRVSSNPLVSVNRMLIVGCVGALVLLVFQYFILEADEPALLDHEQAVLRREAAQPKIIKSIVKPFSFYGTQIKERNIFQSLWEKPKQEDQTAIAAPIISNLSSDFKVLGVMLDDAPKATIEEVKTKKTFIVSVGENIGNAMVEAIFEDKVLLNLNDDIIELGY